MVSADTVVRDNRKNPETKSRTRDLKGIRFIHTPPKMLLVILGHATFFNAAIYTVLSSSHR